MSNNVKFQGTSLNKIPEFGCFSYYARIFPNKPGLTVY